MTPDNATSPHSDNTAEGSSAPSSPGNENWSSALGTLVSSRLAIISAEARIAAEITAKKALFAAIAAITVLLFWIILMAGLIGFIPSVVCGLAWYHVALIIAGLHLLVALIAVLLLKKKTPAPFSITRTEFEKDRQWLSKTQHNTTSRS